jgi:N-acetylneuraminic acid mutarotase
VSERATRARISSAAAAATLLAALASRGSAQASLTRVDGVLGTAVSYQMSADPGSLFVLLPSLTTGPTPLAIVDPLDPRVLEVGLDLVALWKVGFLDGAGAASASYPLPGDPALHGVPFHAQFVTLPGAPTLVDEVSNRTSVMLGLPGLTTYTVGPRPEQLDGHSQTALVDGRLLIAGGTSVDALGNTVGIDGFRLFDPQTQSFSVAGGTMQSDRSAHTATRLADGRVLVLGGFNALSQVLASGDIWDPTTGTSTPTAPMSAPRVQHTATLLADGRVFVSGGVSSYDLTDPIGTLGNALGSSAIYNPATNSWSAGPNLPLPRVGHNATRLGDGRVLVSGGIEVASIFGIPLPSFSSDCRRYNPGTNSFLATAAFSGPRAFHGQVTLSNGNAMIVGGVDGDLILLSFTTLASARVYNAATNSWSNVASLATARVYPTVVDSLGEVMVFGGLATFDVATGSGTPAQSIETASEALGAWTTPTSLLLPRPLVAASPVDGGQRVVITGSGDNGSGGAVPDLTAEIFVP